MCAPQMLIYRLLADRSNRYERLAACGGDVVGASGVKGS